MNDLLIIVIAVAVGTPTGMFLARVLAWAWEAAADLTDDALRKISNRRP